MNPISKFLSLLGIVAIVAGAQTPSYNPSYGGGPYNNPGAYNSSPVDPNEAAADSEAASHGVARLSLMNGGVSVAHGDAGEMAGAVVNAPLVTSDRVLTGGNGRAEVQFDETNLVRISGSTELRMGDLQYKRYLVQIAQGLVTFRILRDNDAQVEISTPSVAVHPLRQGIYRVSVSPDGLTEVTVRAGDAEVDSATGSEPLHAGQTMESRGTAADPEFRTSGAPPYDEWDRWNADRDRIFENYGEVLRRVSPDVFGAEDLGSYGRWTMDPEYGSVWVPNESPDWAPYQDGRWSYLDYYGWTWVGYEPWGWAPYHYGRWFRGSYGWAWYPGAVGARYHWRPALVGFFGWGSPGFGVNLGFGFANVGWVPLAPFEVYRPWYGRGSGGFRNSVIVNNTNIAGIYRNARFGSAVTSMRAGDFGRTAVGRSNFVRATSSDLSHAGMMSGGVPLAASRESRTFGAGGNFQSNTFQGMPHVNQNAHFFSAPTRGTVASPGRPAAGWRRFDPGTARSFQGSGGSFSSGSPAGGFQNGSNFSRGGGFQSGPSLTRGGGSQNPSNGFGASQAVRIAPPIVNNRSQSFGAPRTVAPQGNFGGPRPNFNGGGGYNAPRAAPQGGGFRGAPGGGGGRPTGGGGGHSSGGRR